MKMWNTQAGEPISGLRKNDDDDELNHSKCALYVNILCHQKRKLTAVYDFYRSFMLSR